MSIIIGGLLELSSVVGFFYGVAMAELANVPADVVANLQTSWIPYNGLTTADAATFIPYGDYIVVKDDSDSNSDSSSSSSD
ncbi:hypothetical protein ACP8HI_05195 [Paenibacillus sp. FA6]|uniref:hypothetical protein n=1 Tax=Paenibacillus sp. FA6 TaxID=3413029 RepID=UPI003F656BAE